MLLVFTVISAFGLVLVCFTAPTKVPARLPGQSMFGGLKLNNLFAKEAISPMIINVAFQAPGPVSPSLWLPLPWRSWGSPISALPMQDDLSGLRL